jgi:superfamily I DNA/RNA helicase
MRTLAEVRPTPEQLVLVSRVKPGIEVIRGAAGSGKTTTAILRLRALIGTFVNRKRRQGRQEPVRILVLTYNRTLRGYIKALTKQQVSDSPEIDLTISTFARWAMTNLRRPKMITTSRVKTKIAELGTGLSLSSEFLAQEVDYLLGRFEHDKLGDYVGAVRVGRGTIPRVDRALREAILSRVVEPYQKWKQEHALLDWNDLAAILARKKTCERYDIIIADETQDFSANEIRAIINHVAELHSITFVLDAAQRIYARGFTWQEAGVSVGSHNTHRLQQNYRNTVEIARFAAGIIDGLTFDDDGTMPDFSKCDRHGPKPTLIRGNFAAQTRYVIDYITKNVDLTSQSVALLHPLGGRWFDYARSAFGKANLPFVEITRESEWPEGKENIAFSTIASAKGLEFDHVVMIGLNAEVLPHGSDESDDQLTRLRRLIAMGIGRASRSVIIGYKASDQPMLVRYLKSSTFELVNL